MGYNNKRSAEVTQHFPYRELSYLGSYEPKHHTHL